MKGRRPSLFCYNVVLMFSFNVSVFNVFFKDYSKTVTFSIICAFLFLLIHTVFFFKCIFGWLIALLMFFLNFSCFGRWNETLEKIDLFYWIAKRNDEKNLNVINLGVKGWYWAKMSWYFEKHPKHVRLLTFSSQALRREL